MPITEKNLASQVRDRLGVPRKAKDVFVDAEQGSDGGSGATWSNAYKTMAKAFASVHSGGRIFFIGKIKEQLVTPDLVFDVQVIGAGNRPRHADASPVPAYGDGSSASTWTFPDSGTANTALVRVQQQGWRFENIVFASQTAVAANNAAIQLYRTAEGADEHDASHLEVVGCRFASGYKGIDDIGGCSGVLVKDCFFAAVTIAILGVGNIGAGQVQWVLKDNRFIGFDNGVKIAADECLITGNVFSDGLTPTTTYVLDTTNAIAANNFVVGNYFQTTTTNFNSPDIVGNATDLWTNNFSFDGSAFEVGQPA